MAVLLDTNILLRLLQPHHPHAPMAERALNVLRGRNESLTIVSQNLVESLPDMRVFRFSIPGL